MSINPSYEIRILTLDRTTSNGYVNTIHWEMVGVHTVGVGTEAVTHSARRYGTYGLPAGDESQSGFVPYPDLTISVVEGWWTTGIGSTAVDNIKVGIRTDILNQMSPPVSTGVPW